MFRFHSALYCCLFACLALSLPVPARAAGTYATAGDCGGFPRVQLHTPPHICAGLVAVHLGFARGVAVVDGAIYVADMGGWSKGHGRILRLANMGRAAPQILFTGLDEPNALIVGPGGLLYVGVLGKILVFDPKAADPAASLHAVVEGLPDSGRHPLPALALAPNDALFVNLGSATDHCEKSDGGAPNPAQPCPETLESPPRGTILRVVPGPRPLDARSAEVYARGLRNSMALAVLPQGALLAAVNGRDAINLADPALSDADLPHEPLLRVERGADYGWPYCYDQGVPSPEYPHFDCRTKHPPDRLLPAHAAPLGMLLYQGRALPGLDGRLVLALHGYRANGHRLLSVGVDTQQRPQADFRNLLSGWAGAGTGHPRGAPVGLCEAPDGSLLVTDDHNGTLLRLAPMP